jgi:predicted MarR family transcription regulator
MKKFLLTTVVVVLSVFAGIVIQAQTKPQTPKVVKDYVEILYFHGKQRCVTCKAVGQYSKELVDKDLATLTKQGKLRFREVDFSTPEGEKVADKYRISSSGLVISQFKDNKEKYEDITDFAFQYARTDTPKFKKDLTSKINLLLK